MNVLEFCRPETHPDIPNVWNVLAPYSAAAQAEQGLSFYKQIYREPAAVHKKLQHITNKEVEQINRRLPQIISLADPYANPKTVSEQHCQDFSLPYLFRLLCGLNPVRGGVVHICPYCSGLLEKNKLVRVETRTCVPKPYADILSEYSQAEKLIVTGQQCIHTETVSRFFVLHLINI
ncbi:MAG: hypothetical protein LBT46_08775 [Planctomycetaceae bacterium]|jgi:uroporphyrinogen-III decarboxylase|nr:hypothetical protein [Planctomycetaceae bacterium]